MKTRLLILAMACSFSVTDAQAGVMLVQRVESEGQTGDVTLTLDGDRARVDLSPALSILVNGESGEQVTLMHLTRQYLTMTNNEGKRLAQGLKEYSETGEAEAPRLVATGKKAKVGKWLAEIYTFETGNLKASYWIATDFPEQELILKALEVMRLGATAATTKGVLPGPGDLPGLPLKTEVVLGDRKVTNTLVSVEFGPVDARLFEIPGDYTASEKPAPTAMPKAPAARQGP